MARFPLIPGHEAVGTIAARGKNVTSVAVGDSVVADPIETCRECFYCVRGKDLLCEKITGYGGTGMVMLQKNRTSLFVPFTNMMA